jgi:ribonuclease HII
MSILYQNELDDFSGYRFIAGVDEAGRGPLAGPLVVASCILEKGNILADINDSKILTERIREGLFDKILENSIDYQIAVIPVSQIDRMNILGATMQGMEMVVTKLCLKPDLILLDGNCRPVGLPEALTVVKGDSLYASIAAASILAKVTRDRIMREIHKEYPEYNFLRNKGYPTREHMKAILEYGVTEHHRRSYHPVKSFLMENKPILDQIAPLEEGIDI